MVTPYYQGKWATLYKGDSRDVIPQLGCNGRVSLLCTDSPYGQMYEGRSEMARTANLRGDGSRQGVRLLRQVLAEMETAFAAEAHAYMFCGWESAPDFYDAAATYMNVKNLLIWWKDRGGVGDTECDFARDYEAIVYGIRGRRPLTGRRDGAVLRGHPPVPTKRRIHPTEKPVSLLQYLITKSCPAGGLVLDPFAGSASTLVASHLCGRRAIGIELEERWCEPAARRLEALDNGTSPELTTASSTQTAEVQL